MLSREERIKTEYLRISIYFRELSEDKRAMLEPLLQNAAFMRIALEDLQDQIAKDGPVEQYKNGADQFGLKVSSALQGFNSTIKNYASVIKTLTGLLPSSPKKAAFSIQEEIPDKTEEEWEAEFEEMKKRDDEIRRELEEYSRRQHEQWAREGRPGYT